MAAKNFRVVLAHSALADLEEIVTYWTERDEYERGSQYANDLPSEAIRRLSDPSAAKAGRFLRHTRFPRAQELPLFKRTYRVLYFVDEAKQTVEILRFWHSHRDEPFQQ